MSGSGPRRLDFGPPAVHGAEAEKRNPLPVGTYFFDLLEDNFGEWDEFAKKNRDENRIEVLKDELKPFDVPNFPLPPDDRRFILFKVLTPITWPHETFGSPFVAPQGEKTEDPKPAEPDTPILPVLEPLFTGLKITGGLVLLGLAIYLFTRKD
jgi:hypothetical protein